MNKAFIKIIIPAFVICHLTFVICGAAAADKLEGGGYILYDTINSGGMTLQGGEYILKDSKGEAVGGVMVGGGYSLTPGILKIAAGGVQKIGDAPIGTIPFTISRDGTSIKLTWDANKAKNPSIYVLIGDGTGKYVNDGNDWKLYTDQSFGVEFDNSNLNNGVLIHKAQIGVGHKEAYYKGLQGGVLPGGTNKETNKTNLASAWAVGKVDVEFSVGFIGSNYISYPFIQGNNSIKEVLDVNSFSEGTKIYSQMTGPQKDQYDFDVAKLVNKSWLNSFNNQPVNDSFMIFPEKSYMVQVPQNTKYTMLGRVVNDADARTINIMPYKNTYFGNCRAWAYNLGDNNINVQLKLADVKVGDKIYFPNDTEYNFDVSKYSNGKWINSFTNQPSTMFLSLPKGYMYYHDGNEFSWTR